VGISSRKKRGTGWGAHCRDMEAVKPKTFLGQAINVGRLNG
jgi:hypothetical protein